MILHVLLFKKFDILCKIRVYIYNNKIFLKNKYIYNDWLDGIIFKSLFLGL